MARTPKIPPLGAHMSIAGGTPTAVERAVSTASTALQIFLKNNNQWKGKPISPAEADAFREAVVMSGLESPPIAHSSYLINLASPDEVLRVKSVEAMIDEVQRAAQLGVAGVVVHPGAHKDSGEAAGLATVARGINEIFRATPDNPACIFLETTAGQGTSLGYRFEHLREIIDRVEDQSRVGVCLDTCHVFAAGYDLRTGKQAKAMLKQFDAVVGLEWLRAIHVNDSKKPFGSRRDRHEHIGQGEIGEEGFAALLRDRRLRNVPFILETPKGPDLEEDRMNLSTLRRLAGATG